MVDIKQEVPYITSNFPLGLAVDWKAFIKGGGLKEDLEHFTKVGNKLRSRSMVDIKQEVIYYL